MKNICITIVLLVIAGCNSADRSMEMLAQLDPSDDFESYQMKLGYSALVMSDMTDSEEGKKVVVHLVDLGAFSEARYCAGHLLETGGPDAELHYQVAVCLRNQFQYKKAMEEINKAIALNADRVKYREEQQQLLDLIQTWQQVDSVSQLLSRSNEVTLYNIRARLLISMRKFQPAIYDLNRSLEIEMQNVEAHYLKGMALLYSYDYGEADSLFRELLFMNLSAGQEKLFTRYAESAAKLRVLSDRYASQSRDKSVYLDYSRELSLIGDFDRALRVINRGLETASDDPGLLQARVLVYIQQGKKDEARQAMEYLESLGIDADPRLKQLLN